jgi:hypothetical protein
MKVRDYFCDDGELKWGREAVNDDAGAWIE